jgi:hypothetical protein
MWEPRARRSLIARGEGLPMERLVEIPVPMRIHQSDFILTPRVSLA